MTSNPQSARLLPFPAQTFYLTHLLPPANDRRTAPFKLYLLIGG